MSTTERRADRFLTLGSCVAAAVTSALTLVMLTWQTMGYGDPLVSTNGGLVAGTYGVELWGEPGFFHCSDPC